MLIITCTVLAFEQPDPEDQDGLALCRKGHERFSRTPLGRRTDILVAAKRKVQKANS